MEEKWTFAWRVEVGGLGGLVVEGRGGGAGVVPLQLPGGGARGALARQGREGRSEEGAGAERSGEKPRGKATHLDPTGPSSTTCSKFNGRLGLTHG